VMIPDAITQRMIAISMKSHQRGSSDTPLRMARLCQLAARSSHLLGGSRLTVSG
jgi:hypothetical protein